MDFWMGFVISFLSLILGFFAFSFNKKQQDNKKIESDAEMKAQILYISKGVDEIRLDMKANTNRVDEISEITIRNQESIKSINHRLENLEQKRGDSNG